MFKRVRAIKDSALALSLKTFLNDRFSEVGEVLECELDTKICKIVLTLELPGEPEPVELTLDHYTLEHEHGHRYVVIGTLSCSREWVGLLLNHLFSDKRYKLPVAVGALL
jgi:hypothetical protein